MLHFDLGLTYFFANFSKEFILSILWFVLEERNCDITVVSVVLLLIRESTMTMISLLMNNKKMHMTTPDYTILYVDKTNIILESWKFNRRFMVVFPEVWNVFKSIEFTNGKKNFRYICMERTNNRQHNPIILSIWAMGSCRQTYFVTKTYAHERKISEKFDTKSW